MSAEVVDSSFQGYEGADCSEQAILAEKQLDTDARRRVEDKLEEMRLQREMQEYDFDTR